ncbi:MAG: hypothetical protein J6P95_05825 [Paludibacteraceae bacterium]|nr:hypothetical protein [Paludibacteraceae bacterium]
MKKLGLFLLKNNIHLMTLIFIAWAVWAGCNWAELVLVQKLVLGLYAWLIIHEYEEGYKNRFLDLMLGRVMGIDHRTLTPGTAHLAQALYITIIFSLAIVFPNQLWMCFSLIVLCIFEGYIHNWGIFMFRLKGVSPGWWTAIGMAAYAIWAIVQINQNIEYNGIQWLWGILFFFVGFIMMEMVFQSLIGSSPSRMKNAFKTFIKQRFGKNS